MLKNNDSFFKVSAMNLFDLIKAGYHLLIPYLWLADLIEVAIKIAGNDLKGRRSF